MQGEDSLNEAPDAGSRAAESTESRQDLRVATACSTRARIFAWDRLTACWPVDSVYHRPRSGTRAVPPAPWYPLSAQQTMPAPARASMTPCSRAARTSWTAQGRAGEPTAAGRTDPRRPARSPHASCVCPSRTVGRRRYGRLVAASRPAGRTPALTPPGPHRQGSGRGRPGRRRPR